MKKLRIIFFGTPDFAVESLKQIIEDGFEVVAVVTAPDKPAGRGRKLLSSDVKKFAVEKNIPVLQPTNLKSPVFLEELKSYEANIQVVVAFRMLPVAVWDMPELGTMNLHASLLPDYRGAAPINRVLINGETETGVTTFFLKHKIDTGDLLFQETESIQPDDNAGTLYDRLKVKGGALLVKTLEKITSGDYTPTPQDSGKAIHEAPKIHPETGELDFSKSADTLHNLVRGLAPFPAARTLFFGKVCKIYKTTALSSVPEAYANPVLFSHEGKEILTDNKSYLLIKCGEGFLEITDLKLAGKKRLAIRDFLNGSKFE